MCSYLSTNNWAKKQWYRLLLRVITSSPWPPIIWFLVVDWRKSVCRWMKRQREGRSMWDDKRTNNLTHITYDFVPWLFVQLSNTVAVQEPSFSSWLLQPSRVDFSRLHEAILYQLRLVFYCFVSTSDVCSLGKVCPPPLPPTRSRILYCPHATNLQGRWWDTAVATFAIPGPIPL